eukprot:COSAG04_NODE_51_length_31064_cov_38.384789_22_plen_62_part_00
MVFVTLDRPLLYKVIGVIVGQFLAAVLVGRTNACWRRSHGSSACLLVGELDTITTTLVEYE